MTKSANPHIQKLMDEVERLDPNDSGLEEKLNLIAQKMAAEQRNIKAKLTGRPFDDSTLTDPSDAFACEGCQ
jgi:hypothetical protein